MTAPLTMRTGRTLTRESPLTGGLVTLYRVTPGDDPDVCIGAVPAEMAALIVEAVNARVTASGRLLALADELDASFRTARNEYAKDAYWIAALYARECARTTAAATGEPDLAVPGTGEGERVSVDLSVIVREAVAAEREQVARLAEEHKAEYPHYAKPGFITAHPSFADLIRHGEEAAYARCAQKGEQP